MLWRISEAAWNTGSTACGFSTSAKLLQ